MSRKSWREVFLIAAGMMQNADDTLLLMKQKIDAVVAEHDKLQQLLKYITQKSISVKVPYKLAAIRAFYFSRSCVLDRTPSLSIFLGAKIF